MHGVCFLITILLGQGYLRALFGERFPPLLLNRVKVNVLQWVRKWALPHSNLLLLQKPTSYIHSDPYPDIHETQDTFNHDKGQKSAISGRPESGV